MSAIRTRSRWSTVAAGAVALAALVVGVLTPSAAYASPAAAISGTVTATNGSPLAWTPVDLYAPDGTLVDFTSTNDSGAYSFPGYLATNIPQGDYVVQFEGDSGHVGQYYDNEPDFASADPVTLGNEPLTDIDAELAPPTYVSGTLTTAATVPGTVLLYVELLRPDGSTAAGSVVASDGSFQVGAPASGSYTLKFEDLLGNYPTVWWHDATDLAHADFFALTAGTDLSGFDEQLAQGATVEGTISGSDTHAPLGLDDTGFATASAKLFDLSGNLVDSADVDAQGHYALTGLLAGDYKLEFVAGGYISSWWDGATSHANATKLSIESGADVTGIDVSLDPGASIAGQVQVGTTAVSAWVDVYDAFGNIVASQQTGTDGAYSVAGLVPGVYTVHAQSQGACVNDAWLGDAASREAASTVLLGDHALATGEDIHIPACLTISGVVKGDDQGSVSGLAYAMVDIQSATDPSWSRTVEANNGGAFTAQVPAGDYLVYFEPYYAAPGASTPSYAAQYYRHSPLVRDASVEERAIIAADATTVHVAADASATLADSVLARPSLIAGRVTASDTSAVLPQTQVQAYSDGALVATTTANSAGAYTFNALTPGAYQVLFTPTDNAYRTEWLGGSATTDGATTLTPAAGEWLQNQNIALDPVDAGTSTVSGHVDNGTASTFVELIDDSGSALNAPSDGLGGALDEDGDYSISDVPVGSYTLCAVDTSDLATPLVCLGGGYAAATALTFPVGDGDAVTGKNLTLPVYGTVAGTVTSGDDSVQNEHIRAWQKQGDGWVAVADATTNAAGAYTLTHLAPGTYKLGASEYGASASWNDVEGLTYHDQFWNAATTLDTATEFAIVGNETQTKDFSLWPVALAKFTGTPTPTISGTAAVGKVLTVSTGTWKPTPDAFAYQWNRDGSAIDGATGTSYTVTAADAGQPITVTVTATRTNTLPDSETSAAKSIPGVVAAGTPTIVGSPTVGKKLTVSVGVWTPAGSSFSYQWLRNGAAIRGATHSSYTLGYSDAGKTVSVRVTGKKSGYTASTATSAGVLVGKRFAPAPTPVVTGTPTDGFTLTARLGAWGPRPVSLATQWLSDGTPIAGTQGAGTTNLSYALHSADVGHQLAFRVTATKAGYTTVTYTTIGLLIGEPLTATPTPTISGTGVVGDTLTASAGDWEPAPVTLAYQWLRSGVPIKGATSSTYTTTKSDGGHTLTVRVTGSEAGYTTVAKVSAGIRVGKPITRIGHPGFSGSWIVGQRLTVKPGTWLSGLSFGYQWLRDGLPIAGATHSTYTLAGDDYGHGICVQVTGHRSGYADASATSDTFSVAGAITQAPVPTISGTPTVGQTLSATTGTWGPGEVVLSYQWKRGTAVVGTDSRYSLTPADAGASITVTVTGSEDGFASVSKTSGSVAVRLALTAGTPAVSGTARVGSRLTATPGTWAPAPVSLAYQWLRDGVAIRGATSSTYTLSTADRGHAVSVSVTGSKSGYTAVAATSPSVTVS